MTMITERPTRAAQGSATSIDLYDLPDELRAVDDDCPECHGEFVSVDASSCPTCQGDPLALIGQRLEFLRELELQTAVKRLARRIFELDADAKTLEDHVAAVSQRAQSRRRTVEGMKRWMQLLMERAGVDKVKDPFVTVWLADNPESIEIVDLEKLPREFKRATLQMPLAHVPPNLAESITKIDALKTPIKAHLEETGEILPGVEFHAKGHTRNLRVRQ